VDALSILALADSALRLSIPLLFACLAGLWSERSGVVDIGLEGKMLAAAFAAAAAASAFGTAAAGLCAAILAALAFALLHGFACISQRGNQIVSGVALNMLAAGLTAVLGHAWYGEGGRTPPLDAVARIPDLLFGHSLLVYLALAAVPLTAFVMAKTRFGLRLRAVGENPAAVDTAGVSVAGLRYAAVLIGGVLCGLGGAYLAIALSAGFIPNMTAGKGFIALAALIFAKWRPWPALGACLLFGFLDAFGIRYQGIAIAGVGTVPVQFMQALPYILTVVILAGFVGSLPEQERAERDALQVDGVAAVADEIEIRVPAADVKPDPVLARQAVESLRFELPEVWDRIIVSVRAAWADLEGQVDDSRQRERAEAAMRRVRGLRGFTNLIRVRASVPVARSPAANR